MQALLSRLPDQGASIERKINETENELKEAEMIAGSKENAGAQVRSRPAAPAPVVDLSAEKHRTAADRHDNQPPQKPKPLGFNNSIPVVSTLPAKKNPITLSPAPTVKTPSVPKPQLVAEMPNWSLLSDSPTSSRDSPAPTSRVDIDDMSEALSSLKLRLH